jgi:hypothetical protein
MARWLWLFLSIFALAGLLASTPGRACAADMQHTLHAQHDCCPGKTSAQHDQMNHGSKPGPTTLPGCCVVGLCACHVAQPAPLRIADLLPVTFSTIHFVGLRHDDGHVGQSRPPDLRPPIA